MYIVGKYIIYLYEHLKPIGKRVCVMQITFIFTDNVRILRLYSKVKKSETNVKLSKKSRNKRRSNQFHGCPLSSPHSYCYCL